jgi:hypothetical protein
LQSSQTSKARFECVVAPPRKEAPRLIESDAATASDKPFAMLSIAKITNRGIILHMCCCCCFVNF